MKAIQIKYLSATNTKPNRLKAWTDAGEHIESIDSSMNVEDNARLLAQRYIDLSGWGDTVEITGFGMIKNGDYVATLGSI